jgi:hypothetical protein
MSASNSLRGRVPGQSVMREVVAKQRSLPPQSRLARFRGVNPVVPANREIYRAALGELLVGDTLDHLGPEWDVLHVVPVTAGDPEIDHLVIGPAGVFTIWTKNFPGHEVWVGGETLLVGGQHHDDIPGAKLEAERASALLSAAVGRAISVEPILVVANPKKLVIREQPSNLVVVSSKQLLRWLTRLDRQLDGTEVASISDIADRDSTWHSPIEPGPDTQQLHRDFANLRADVGAARSTRMLWGGSSFLVIAVVVWAGVAVVVQYIVSH